MKYLVVVIAAGILASTANARELVDSRYITGCASITDKSARLECYDATAEMIAAKDTANPEKYLLRRFKVKKTD